ncbi:PLP-dependent aminotransferase family protein [Uliginosibacterium sp. sgz301328]|uniref:aminotransferase-like domain-containing protein n=1 Tax=Uliginosibacterium sp. sgz301328 TaxID=3243764 RepID=UPI00359EDDAB
MQLSLSPESAVPLVDQIVGAVRGHIDDRLLRPGARLPAIRQLAERHGVSRFTVVEAYDRLVAQGYLQSRRGAGFFVAAREDAVTSAVPATQRQQAIDVAWLMRRALSTDPRLLQASVGWLPPSWLDSEGVQKAVRLMSRAGEGARFGCYGEPNGYRPLREQLRIMLGGLGIEAAPDQMVLTLGATQALDLISRFMVRPGDTVLVDDPGYFNLFGALRLLGAHLIGVPRLEDGPDTEALEALAAQYKPRLFITHSVLHNPTGSNLSPATAYRVLQTAERHDFLIVEDDTYGDLSPAAATRLASLDQLNRVMFVGSFSKTLSSNVRVGFVASSPALAEQLADIKLLTAVSTSEFTEQIIHRLLSDGHYRKHVERLRSRLGEATVRTARMLESAGLEFRFPDSGVFIWAKVPGEEDVSWLAEQAERHDIMLAPGKVFRPQLQPSPYLRINVAYANDVRLERFLNEALAARG